MSQSKVLTFRYPQPLRIFVSCLGFIPLFLLEGIVAGNIQLAPGGMARVLSFLACAMIPFLVPVECYRQQFPPAERGG